MTNDILSLTDMPDDVMGLIVDKLGLKDRSKLFQTCHSFQNFLENGQNFKTAYEMVNLTIEKNNFDYFKSEDDDVMKFKIYIDQNGKPYTFSDPKSEKLPKIAFSGTILKIDFLDLSGISENNFSKCFENVLPNNMEIRKIKILGHTLTSEPIISTLSKLRPLKVEEIWLEDTSRYGKNVLRKIDISEISKTEQWKNAKSVLSYGACLQSSVKEIAHLEQFFGQLERVTMEELVFLKETFMTNHNFNDCYIELDWDCEFDLEEAAKIFGPTHDPKDYSNPFLKIRKTRPTPSWNFRHFKIPNSEDYLHIEITCDWFSAYRSEKPDCIRRYYLGHKIDKRQNGKKDPINNPWWRNL